VVVIRVVWVRWAHISPMWWFWPALASRDPIVESILRPVERVLGLLEALPRTSGQQAHLPGLESTQTPLYG
jgi:hypothetical protein